MSWVPDNQVQTAGDRNIDFINQEIIVEAPAVLVMYLGGDYAARNIQNRSYAISEKFLLIAVAENSRGWAEARRGLDAPGQGQDDHGLYELLEGLKDIFGGPALTLDSGDKVYPVIVSIAPEGINRQNQLCYGLEIVINGNWQN
jgi:hypothetical protein